MLKPHSLCNNYLKVIQTESEKDQGLAPLEIATGDLDLDPGIATGVVIPGNEDTLDTPHHQEKLIWMTQHGNHSPLLSLIDVSNIFLKN